MAMPQSGSFVAMPSSYGGYGGYGGYSSYGGYPAQTMSYAQPSYGYASTPSYGTMPTTGIGMNPLMAYVPGGGAYAPTTDEKPATAPVKRAVKKGKAGGSCCC